jgi:hypothetical protein
MAQEQRGVGESEREREREGEGESKAIAFPVWRLCLRNLQPGATFLNNKFRIILQLFCLHLRVQGDRFSAHVPPPITLSLSLSLSLARSSLSLSFSLCRSIRYPVRVSFSLALSLSLSLALSRSRSVPVLPLDRARLVCSGLTRDASIFIQLYGLTFTSARQKENGFLFVLQIHVEFFRGRSLSPSSWRLPRPRVLYFAARISALSASRYFEQERGTKRLNA